MRKIYVRHFLVMALILTLSAVLLMGCQNTVVIQPPGEDTNEAAATEAVAEETSAAESESAADSGSASDIPEGFMPGKRAYDFELENLAGEKVKLSDYRGNVVVLNFFASWCPPCQVEMPHINKVYNTMKDDGVVILGINLTEQDNMSDLEALLADNDIAFPILLDKKSEVAMRYGIRSIPVNVVIDAEGVVTEYAIGAIDETRLTDFIEAAKGQ